MLVKMGLSLKKQNVQVVILFLLMLVITLTTLYKQTIAQKYDFFDPIPGTLSTKHTKHTKPLFDQKVDDILTKKKKVDREDAYWAMDTEITRGQTQLKVPEYFLDKSHKQVIGPFDPRFTLAVYYSYIARHPETLTGTKVQFHWSDWVDLSPLNKILFSADKKKVQCSDFNSRRYQMLNWPEPKIRVHMGALDSSTYCRKPHADEESELGFVITKPFGRMLKENALLLAKSYLYTQAPNPLSIVFLSSDGTYTIDLEKKKVSFLKGDMVPQYLKTKNGRSKQINTLDELRLLKKNIPASKSASSAQHEVQLNQEDFKYNPIEILNKLKNNPSQGTSTEHIENYKASVALSITKQNNPPKYFYEASIFDTVVGEHYDWRFYNGIILGTQEQANTLHRMVRSWLSFTKKVRIITWVAHGSLLSWYWNGMAFPWDQDIDVQLPVMQLHKLCLKFNQSLIVENGSEGFGRFLVDCGTYISTRGHNNGLNNIDARFIDIDSGLYIDITALALSSDPPPKRYLDSLPQSYVTQNHPQEHSNDLLQVYNCRNFHFLSLTELSPLVRTLVDGEVAYVPSKFSDILSHEYSERSLLKKYYGGRVFVPHLRLWVHHDSLIFFMRHRSQWKLYYQHQGHSHQTLEAPTTEGSLSNQEVQQLQGLHEKDYLDLLLADDILETYTMTREFTAIHEAEMMRLLFGKPTSDVVGASAFKPLTYEPYLYKLNRYFITYEARLQTFARLQDRYEVELGKVG